MFSSKLTGRGPRAFTSYLARGLCWSAFVTTLAHAQQEIIVHLHPGVPAQAFAQTTGTVLLQTIPGSSIHLLAMPPGTTALEYEAALTQMGSSPQARSAEPNTSVSIADQICPSSTGGSVSIQQCTIGFVDGSPSHQLYLNQNWLGLIGATRTQALPTVQQVVVAVLDTGVDPTHPALANRLAGPGYDFLQNRPGGYELLDNVDTNGNGVFDEAYGHGTHVAGTIVLVAPNARILPLRVVDSDGVGDLFQVTSAVWMAAHSGARIINLSLSSMQPSQALADALHFAITLGVDVFTSAGNTGSMLVLFPANLPSNAATFVPLAPIFPHGVIAVAAIDPWQGLATFSAYGPSIDLCAPGVAIYGPYPDDRYAWWSGTSMACAVASGSAALVESVTAQSAGASSAEALVRTSSPLRTEAYLLGWLGSGRVDAYRAALEYMPK